MDVEFTYTRDDWTHISTQFYKDWLHGLRPLTDLEYWTCWLLLVASLLGGLACTAWLGYALWSAHAWYVVAGAACVLLFLCGMVLETLNPRREAVRGVVHELIFRLNWDAQLVARMRDKRDAHFRRLQEQGQLDLDRRYRLHINPDGYTLVVDYAATDARATRQETRRSWADVDSIHLDERMLFFKIGGLGYEAIPRAAFSDDEACRLFAKTAEEHYVRYATTGSGKAQMAGLGV